MFTKATYFSQLTSLYLSHLLLFPSTYCVCYACLFVLYVHLVVCVCVWLALSVATVSNVCTASTTMCVCLSVPLVSVLTCVMCLFVSGVLRVLALPGITFVQN